MLAQNKIFLTEEVAGKGHFFKARFLQPGLVKYSFGVCLLTKEVIDSFVQGFVGCSVTIDHVEINEDNCDDVCCGVISRVEYKEEDGWYWCEGILRDPNAIELVRNGYTVSCQYEITEYADNTEGVLHNGIEYDKVILGGKCEHLAIVKNPRYEGAMIAVNALDKTNSDEWITLNGAHIKLEEGETVKDFFTKRLKDKYKENLGEIDIDILRKDIGEAGSLGYETPEDLSNFLGVDINKIKEVLDTEGESEEDNRGVGYLSAIAQRIGNIPLDFRPVEGKKGLFEATLSDEGYKLWGDRVRDAFCGGAIEDRKWDIENGIRVFKVKFKAANNTQPEGEVELKDQFKECLYDLAAETIVEKLKDNRYLKM